MTRKPRNAKQNNPDTPDRPGADETTSLFRRWSDRKRRARAGQAVDPDPAMTLSEPPSQAAEDAEEKPERVLSDEDMPPLESLTEDSDYSGFFSPGVSEHLRRAALRKLFSSAKLNVVDGLDDYAEDYRSFEALGDIITSDMRFDMERKAEREKQALDEVENEVAAGNEVAASDAEPEAGEIDESTEAPADVQGDDGERHVARGQRDRRDNSVAGAPEDKTRTG